MRDDRTFPLHARALLGSHPNHVHLHTRLTSRHRKGKTPFTCSQWVERQQNLRDNWIQTQRQSLNFKDPQATSKLNSGNPGYMHTSQYCRPRPPLVYTHDIDIQP